MNDAKTPMSSPADIDASESPIDEWTIDATNAVKEAIDALIRRAAFDGNDASIRRCAAERAALASAISLLAGSTLGERAYIVRALRK